MRTSDGVLLLLSALLVLGCVTGCGIGDSRTPEQLLQEGVAAWKGGRIEEAEDLLNKAVGRAQKAGIDKHTMRAYHGALFALYAAGNRHAEAEKAYAGVETTPDLMINPVAGHNLGVLRLRAGENSEAAEILRATLHRLRTAEGAGDERPLELMTLIHADLALLAAGKRDAAIGGEVLDVLRDLLRFQEGHYPYLHPAHIRELSVYADRLRNAGRAEEAGVILDRVQSQRARGAAPGVSENTCLLLNAEWPVGCILSLKHEG